MDLGEFIENTDRRRSLAAAVGTVPEYLWQIATNRRKAGPKLARKIHAETHGLVTLESLRPDVWGTNQVGE
jgi:DNA-binding transcriptional regulator YdaS (Cro superfamily)